MFPGKFVLSIILIATFGNAFCQLAPFQDEDALVAPIFQGDVIKAKKISSITMHDLFKPDGLPISDDGIIHQYFFDTTGKITESKYTVKANGDSHDTVKCRYYYDAKNNIIIKRTQTGDFFDTWYYKWNKDNMLQREEHVHETSTVTADGSFKIASQKVIAEDSFAYMTYPKQLQQYAYNEDNKEFQKTIIQYDDKNRCISRSCHYAVGWLYSQVDITYDASGRVCNYLNTGNLNGDMNQSTITKYDSAGKVGEQNIWSNGKQKHHIEYLYDNTTGLISDKLDRDIGKATIKIIRFNYVMYGLQPQPVASGNVYHKEAPAGRSKSSIKKKGTSHGKKKKSSLVE